MLSFVAGIFGGLISGLLVRILGFFADNRSKQADGLVTDVVFLADLATEYWHSSGSNLTLGQIEDRIVGRQHRLTVTIADVYPGISDRLPECMSALQNFMDSVSGGSFRTPGRQAETRRSAECQVSAGLLIYWIRKAARQYYPHPGFISWWSSIAKSKADKALAFPKK